MKPRNGSLTAAIFRQAARLEKSGEWDEARRLFHLVLHQPDTQYWDGAEFHLGSIEAALGRTAAAQAHFTACLRLNPTHHKARRALDKPVRYQEVDANVFERIRQTGSAKPLFVLFGDLDHVVTALPVVKALREKFGEVSWLTSPRHAALARASQTGRVYETQSRGTIPWNWIHAQDFSHVFFPGPDANQEEWEHSRINPIDFMAKKCGVKIAAYRPRLEPPAAAVAQAEAFLRENRLTRRGFVSASSGDGQGRHWPNSNLTKLAQQIGVPTIVFGKPNDPPVPGTIACTDKALDAIAVLIEWSSFYLGPAYGISWIATTTDTPMAVFYDPWRYDGSTGFGEILHGEKPDIQEWDIYTNLPTVLDHLESVLSTSATRLPGRQYKPAKKHL
jgi:hypothetical protein